LVLEAGRRGQRVGICRIDLDSTRNAVSAHNRITNLFSSHTQPDSLIHQEIVARTLPGMDDSLAWSAVELLPGIGDYSPLGAWVAENLRQQMNAAIILPFSALDWALLKGTVTSRAIRRIVPYDEDLVSVKLTDLEITQVLDELLNRDPVHTPIAAGITYRVVRPDSSTPQIEPRVISIKKAGPAPDVVLPRWLAMSSGLPGREYRPMKETYGDLLVARIKAHGIVLDSAIGSPPPAAQSPQSQVPGKLNINTATREQLMSLPGIGPAFGKRIVEYRQQHGQFTKIEDLMNVKGLGPKRFDKIKDKVTI